MIKSISKFVLKTVALAIVGLLFVIVGTINFSSVSLTGVSVIGALLFFFSPALAAFWTWIVLKKDRNLKDESMQRLIEEERQAIEEQDKKEFMRRRFLERQRLIDSVDRHRSALIRNVERAKKRNDYGVLVENKSNEALDEFFASIDLDMNLIASDDAIELVFEHLNMRNNEDRQRGFDAKQLPFDGHDFEKWVAEALIGFGWTAEVTSGSNDQGIDVIAEQNGKRLGIQCKLYSSAIGNKAVQEAHAGKFYYDVDAVAVLSNASYTSSAKDLATVTGVELLSHHDIPEVYEKVFGQRSI